MSKNVGVVRNRWFDVLIMITESYRTTHLFLAMIRLRVEVKNGIAEVVFDQDCGRAVRWFERVDHLRMDKGWPNQEHKDRSPKDD